MKTICGVDCSKCEMNKMCKGCIETDGRPFGDECVIAKCCKSKKYNKCNECENGVCEYKQKIIDEFNALDIKDMPKITELYQLKGSFVNVEYKLESMQNIKFWNDNKIYLGTQVKKENSDRCYGLTADDEYLLVCEYGKNGDKPEIIIFKKR